MAFHYVKYKYNIVESLPLFNLANESLTALTQVSVFSLCFQVFSNGSISCHLGFVTALLKYNLYIICHLGFKFLFSCALNKHFLSHQM